MHEIAHPRCSACGETPALREPYYYDWRDRRFWIYRCGLCTHQFVHPPVTPEDQRQIYSDTYFSKEGDWVCGIFESGYTGAERQLKEEAHSILDMLPVASGQLLDVGCAGGVFLNEARARGFDVAGLELNSTMAAYAAKTYHLQVLNSRVEDVAADHWNQQFDVVTLLDCLEHIPAPLSAMMSIWRWLRPGGVVFIRGPRGNSRIARLKESIRRVLQVQKRLPGYPLDANMFNNRSLEVMLATSGFDAPVWIGQTPTFANLWARKASPT